MIIKYSLEKKGQKEINMISNNNVIYIDIKAEIAKRIQRKLNGGMSFKEQFCRGAVFHIEDEFALNEPDSVLIFEGMEIQWVEFQLGNMLLCFDYMQWSARKKSREVIVAMQERKKRLRKSQKGLAGSVFMDAV